jgi:penicillin-binding protein 1C
MPKFRKDCFGEIKNALKFIYPTEKTTIYLPKDFNGNRNETILKATHSNTEATLYWYVNSSFIATTKEIHELSIILKSGNYVISITDNFGNEIKQELVIKE